MKKQIVMCFTLLMGSVLVLAQSTPMENMKKEKMANRTFEQIKELIDGGQYEFVADRLISSTGFSNSLVTNPNTIRVHGEMVKVFLPYFGEVRANSPYQVDGGIKYEGSMENYSVEYRDAKRRAIIKFTIDRGIEEHNFIFTVNKSGQTRVTVISSGRTSISYYGNTSAPDEDWVD